MMGGVEIMVLLGASSILFGAGALWVAHKRVTRKQSSAQYTHTDVLDGMSASSVDVGRSSRLVGPVSKVSREYPQPKGGLIPVKWAERISFSGDLEELKDGMLSPQAVGMVVDYLSRLVLFGSAT